METNDSVSVLLVLEACALACFLFAFSCKRRMRHLRHKLLAATKHAGGELTRKYRFLTISRRCLMSMGIVLTALVCYVIVMAATVP
jgi:hypothetical protein